MMMVAWPLRPGQPSQRAQTVDAPLRRWPRRRARQARREGSGGRLRADRWFLSTPFRPRAHSCPSSRGFPAHPKKWKVFELLNDGLGTAEIASNLFVADVTLRAHRAAIIRKLRAKDRAGVLHMVRGESA